jgi:hypothetical protein
MKFEKAIKKAVLAVVGAGSSLVIAACYGAYYGMQDTDIVSGRVTNPNGAGVGGLEVCADVPGHQPVCTETADDGSYLVEGVESEVDAADVNGFLVTVKDVDGYENGLYGDEEVAVGANSVPAVIDVEIQPVE